MLDAVWVALFAPLVGFFVIMTFHSYFNRKIVGAIACATVLISFLIFATLTYFYELYSQDAISLTLFNWVPIDKIDAKFALHIDSLALLMTLIITGVGFLIHLYSNGYMEHDPDYARFFACLNLFIFAMLLLVLADNLLLLFVGWEGVGLASYLLIGFYYYKNSAAVAATKAFVVNRVGDLGLLLGLLLTFYTFGTSNMAEINAKVGKEFAAGAPVISLIALLFFIGATGKSAQLPLHVWLPDAMEGPTPVSALIHAATMVTAGVYLTVRMHGLFMAAPDTLYLVGAVGAVTSLYAALSAIGQTDLKRVLAYSTISQLGLMFTACGVGAFYAAMFHLTAHAFMKGLLFLSAGNIVHMLHDITDMGVMGGLEKRFKVTHWLFFIGVIAMSGIPPLVAFFSKDLILELEHAAGYYVLYWIALIACIFTAFYLTRAYCLTFLGQPRMEAQQFSKIQEAPYIMLIPVSVLAFLSIFGGALGFPFGTLPPLESFISQVGLTKEEIALTSHFAISKETIVAIFGAVSGIFVAGYLYLKNPNWVHTPLKVLNHAFYINEIYDVAIVKPLEAIARFIANIVEPKFFTGTIKGVSHLTDWISRGVQKMQSGEIRSYLSWMVLGAVLLIFYLVF